MCTPLLQGRLHWRRRFKARSPVHNEPLGKWAVQAALTSAHGRQ
jgi:hypothetical protein